MIWQSAMLCVLAALGDVEVRTFPLANPRATCFVAPADADGRPELFVLDGYRVSVFREARPDREQVIELPKNTSAVDVFDLDADGTVELLAVDGERILAYSWDSVGTTLQPIELFRRANVLSGTGSTPFLYLLGVEADGRPLIALPCADSFELREITGELVADAPMREDAPHRASFGRPFGAAVSDPPRLGPPEALEFEIRQTVEVEPALPLELPFTTRRFRAGAAPPAGSDVSSEENLAYWPWFPLAVRDVPAGVDAAPATWDVLYTATEDGYSLVRLRTEPATPGGKRRAGPERRFPGRILNSVEERPDFNGDGYADLVLLDDAIPLPSPTQTARAIALGRSPRRITVHLFEPRARRFSPNVNAALTVDAPSGPLWGEPSPPLLVFEDFDGDGKTDAACAGAGNTLDVWRFEEQGFASAPALHTSLPEPPQAVEIRLATPLAGGAIVGLRAAEYLYLLVPSM